MRLAGLGATLKADMDVMGDADGAADMNMDVGGTWCSVAESKP
jgi:hypothetical protein